MKLVAINDVFDVSYGNSLELNALEHDSRGVNFVSRASKNNGVSGKVKKIEGEKICPKGSISVALGGSVLETFLQPEDYYTGYHVFCLIPKIQLSEVEKLTYCTLIKANQYRYNYGRQANKTFAKLMIPSPDEVAKIAKSTTVPNAPSEKSYLKGLQIHLPDLIWKAFRYDGIFHIKKGRRLTKGAMAKGNTPFIGAVDSNNGHRQYINAEPDHPKNVITVNYNGSVAEAFYQSAPFRASDDVNVLYPNNFELTSYIAMFLCSLIRKERFRFNYGRKWHLERMRESIIRLPVTKSGDPDWNFIENYIKSLPYSANLK